MRMILGREVRDEKHFRDFKISIAKIHSPVKANLIVGPLRRMQSSFYTGVPADNRPLPRNWLFVTMPENR